MYRAKSEADLKSQKLKLLLQVNKTTHHKTNFNIMCTMPFGNRLHSRKEK